MVGAYITMPRGQRTDLPTTALVVEMRESEGLSQQEIADKTGIPRTTIEGILSDKFGWGEIKGLPVFIEHRRLQKQALQAAFLDLTRKSLMRAEESLPKASYLQAVTGAGILIDKERLYAGEATVNVAVALDSSSVEAIDQLARALSQSLLGGIQVGDSAETEAEITQEVGEKEQNDG